jgi:splicing factor 3B subunit 2
VLWFISNGGLADLSQRGQQSGDESQQNGGVNEERRFEQSSNTEYVSEQLDLNDAGLEAFSDVFARFQLPPDETSVRYPPNF